MPGIDIAAPERTEISSGFLLSPKPLPVFFYSAAMWLRISSIKPAGNWFFSR